MNAGRTSRKKYAAVLALAVSSLALVTAAGAADPAAPGNLGTMVVTAPPMTDPITVETDPKAPRQPVPASDGASFLKNIPGFSVTRKGGTDGDPTFRGLGGSRLNILQNGDYIFGGCGNRMDPPTAYIYPEIFDSVRVVKGPQTVLYGGGNLAGAVLFERYTERFEEAGGRLFGSLLAGSYGRNDQVVDGAAGVAQGFARVAATRSGMDDYEDGDGREVHSEYERWNISTILGWTPTADSRVEVNLDRSDGEAAYADRMMDGVEFDRTGYGVRLESRNISGLVERLEFKAYHNYVDHVMDNFSLRTVPGAKMINNPDRTTLGGRLESQLNFTAATFLIGGVDYQRNEHTLRTAMSPAGIPVIDAKTREDDAEFRSLGVFGELTHELNEQHRLIGGLRLDDTEAEALKMSAPYGTVAAGTSDDSINIGAFLRYERDLTDLPLTLYAGVGRAERSPDYWERAKKFSLDTEKSSQLDLGLGYRSDAVQANLSLFYTEIDDFISIQQAPATALNVNATLYGGEADISYRFAENWRINTTLAYTHGDDDTFDTPLAQVAPLEGTLGLVFDDAVFTAGASMRAVARQDRVHIGYGSIVGQDIGETAGFATAAANFGYRAPMGVNLTAGIDNLFDNTYAEHISRAGAMVSGFVQTTRVNEPGRFMWLKASIDL
ncbi:MAG: TonB-dependent copper receptor [Thermodesulfobacteriota bacterium]